MPRLAIVGGGIGGVATAYFCDPAWTIDLFEAEPRLGGNAATVHVDDDAVDLGAETFHPATHPLYWSLLHEIGADDTIIEIPGTVSVFDAVTGRSRFVSSRPLRTPASGIAFARFIGAARRLLGGDPSPDLTVGEWFAQHPFGRFGEDVLLPWLSSLTSSRVETLEQQSMPAFLTLFAPAFPKNLLAAPKTFGSRIGLGGVVERLADGCGSLRVHTNAPVSRVFRDGPAWFVETATRLEGPYENVVVNAPPYAARDLLPPGIRRDILDRYEYYPARLIIHDDPIWMPAARRDWSFHNAAVSPDSCEATFWLGAYRTDASGRPVELFKSWATHRDTEPRAIRAERTFHHLLLTPAAVRAAEELTARQGEDGLYFVGHATTMTDLQETALRSAMDVARALGAAIRP